uniref:Molybdopterin synthase catalytic subunit n=2 Tax=Rhodnius prolixus TaxID=13249 RepID=T1I7L9_RHOPR
MNIIEIVKEKIEVEVLIDKVKSPKCGAISVFLGTTRNTFQDLEVITLFYEAYESMAMKAIEAICTQIRNKWPLIENIAVSHRLGEVGVTETSVVIAISSPHRAESLAAVNFAIEELKSTVPIWKKEIYKEEVGKWKENKECAWRTNEN